LLGVTGNLHAAIVLCERTRPDVVLVDAMLDPRCHLGSLLQGSDDTLPCSAWCGSRCAPRAT
jgi:hypothetical protein